MIHELGWLLFFVALIGSVCIHEAGHFVMAKRFGMKATQFFAGFGPTVWSFQRGETEYGIKAIPAGGFVKIIGMTALEEVDPEDEPRAFYKQKAWKRTVVLAAGLVHALRHRAGAVLGGAAAARHQPGRRSPSTQVTCVKATTADTCSAAQPGAGQGRGHPAGRPAGLVRRRRRSRAGPTSARPSPAPGSHPPRSWSRATAS